MNGFSITLNEMISQDVMFPLDMTDVPTQSYPQCPCCGTLLRTAAEFFSDAGKKIRVGACGLCGYMGYLDRPTDAWLHEFYTTKWDTKISVVEGARRVFKRNNLVEEISKLQIPKSAKIFEIGVGYGQILEQLQHEGFSAVTGIEHSPHRAKASGDRLGIRIFSGAFGDAHLQEDISSQGPFEVIISKSVLEHVTDPAKMFSSAAALQSEGGYLLIIVPDVWHEVTPQTLMFLPHLHGFTDRALTELARRAGYKTIAVHHHGMGLLLVAQKDSSSVATASHHVSAAPASPLIEEKWIKELHLAELPVGRRRIVWWSAKDPNMNGVAHPFLKLLFATQWLFPLRRLLFGLHRRSGSFVIEVESSADSLEVPLRIRSNPLRLYYK